MSRIKTFKNEKPFNNFLTVTKGQLEYEFKHLCRKVMKRDRDWFIKIKGQEWRDNYHIKPHPLFKVIDGEIESWEKIKKEK